MSARPRVTVVGNGVSGFACARDLATRGARVTLVGPGLPCDRPPLSKRALLSGRLPYLASARDLAVAGIDHVDGWARDLDLDRRLITIQPANGESRVVPFEHLVWATGLRTARPPISGLELAGENSHPAGLERLRPALSRPGRDVVVIGAGLIGAETAAALSGIHRVTLVERGERPLERFHPRISAAALEVLGRLGVRFLGGSVLETIGASAGSRRMLRVAGRAPLAADVVINSAGVTSTLPPPFGAGPQVETDERLAVPGYHGVWVCGDLVRYPHPRYGHINVPHWDTARAAGRHVAAGVLGSTAPFQREPYWFSDIGPLRIQMLGYESSARTWQQRDGLTTGLDGDGRPCCVVLMNAPGRLAEARKLLALAA